LTLKYGKEEEEEEKKIIACLHRVFLSPRTNYRTRTIGTIFPGPFYREKLIRGLDLRGWFYDPGYSNQFKSKKKNAPYFHQY